RADGSARDPDPREYRPGAAPRWPVAAAGSGARQLGARPRDGGDAGATGRAVRSQPGDAQEDGAAAEAKPERPPILKGGPRSSRFSAVSAEPTLERGKPGCGLLRFPACR